MFKPEVSGFDPYAVFDPEYWGDIVPSVKHEVRGMGSSGRPYARALLNLSGVKVIEGSITGPEAPKGTVMDISDPDLNRASFYNYPGNILIVDYERLERNSSRPTPGLEPDDVSDFTASPRKLLQDGEFIWNDSLPIRSYGSTIISLSQGDSHYRRTASLVVTAPGRRGSVDIFEVFSFTPRQPQHHGWATLWTGTKLRGHRVEVGQSYQDSEATDELYRLRSVEVAVTGAPARVPKKALSFLWGSLSRPTEA